MSISSISSGASLWSLYTQDRAAAKNTAASGGNELNPAELIKQLKEYEGDPEQLKTKAAELQAQVEAAAESSSAKEAEMLGKLASDLASVAESGDLSVMTDKMPPRPGAMNGAPNGSENMSVGGLGGGQELSI